MQINNEKILFSPSDLIGFMDSSFVSHMFLICFSFVFHLSLICPIVLIEFCWFTLGSRSGNLARGPCLSLVSLASPRPPPPPASSGARALGRHGSTPWKSGGYGGILGQAPLRLVAHHPQQPRLHTSKDVWGATGPRCVSV